MAVPVEDSLTEVTPIHNVGSRNLLSGTGLTINRLPAEWTTCIAEPTCVPKCQYTKFKCNFNTILQPLLVPLDLLKNARTAPTNH